MVETKNKAEKSIPKTILVNVLWKRDSDELEISVRPNTVIPEVVRTILNASLKTIEDSCTDKQVKTNYVW